jgi:hypothetical protein
MFRAPEPVFISIGSYRPVDRAIRVLSNAAATRRLSDRGIDYPRYLRLSGRIDGSDVVLTATPYVTTDQASFRDFDLTVTARVRPRLDGSELSGTASSPVPSKMPWFLGGWSVIVAVLFIVGTPSLWGLLTMTLMGALVACLWTVIIRHNQRTALSHIARFEEMLIAILNEEPEAV